VVAGPTSSGKSALAIALARKCNGEIISADSRQVYRGMDIGTGKVTKREQKLACHWMLDIASPKRQYSVAQWKRAAQRAIADITRRGKLPIVCGGTGFWIDALVYDATLPEVKPNSKFRAILECQTTEQLFARLSNLDPARASSVDRHNRRRLVRALEIIEATGTPVPRVESRKSKAQSYRVLYLGISVPKETLARRIERRLDARLKAGMIAEVRRLHASGVSWKRLESFGLEYRWVSHFLRGSTSEKEMREGLLRDIIRYSKRQATWFKRNKDITWITGSTPLTTSAQATRLVRTFLPRHEELLEAAE
jgi:tRNA dimethylallyltransferase